MEDCFGGRAAGFFFYKSLTLVINFKPNYFSGSRPTEIISEDTGKLLVFKIS